MATRISHIPFYRRMTIPSWKLFIAAVLYALPVAFLSFYKPLLAVGFAAAPLAIMLVAHGPIAIYVLLAATFLFMPIYGSVTLLPADIAAVILVGAYAVDLICRGASRGINRLARPLLVYLTVVLLSVAVGGFTGLSIKFFMRQVLLAASFLAVAHFTPRMRIRNLLIGFVLIADVNSIYALLQFFGAGGGIRAFGLAGQGYGDHVMLAFLVAVIFYLWIEDLRGRLFWGASMLILVAALAATQTRASIISAGWAGLIAVILALRLGKRIHCRIPRKNLFAALLLMALVIPILALYTPMFEGVAHRFERIGPHAGGTILLRLSLWKAALTAFWNNPILGIGAGNFATVYNWVPTVRFDPVFFWVSGMSTHSVLMTALAETGILGFVTMFFFFGRALKVSWRNMKEASTTDQVTTANILFISALVIVGSSLYGGSWFWGNNSYHMAVFFGMIASYHHRLDSSIREGSET